METEDSLIHFQILLTGTIGITLLVVFIIGFVVKYQNRRIKEQEERRKLIESSQEKILAAMLQTQEEERKRMARDLHDELGNALAVAKMNISRLSKSLTGADNQETASQTYAIIDDTLKNIRRLSKDLHPVMLEKYGLAAALEALGKKCSSGTLTIMLKTTGELTGLPADQELHIFRIVQELLSNALKHSRATVLDLDLEVKPGRLLMHYTDNGIGFSNRQNGRGSTAETGIGMLTIDARVRILKGTWQLESEAGKGTTAAFSFPVKKQLILS